MAIVSKSPLGLELKAPAVDPMNIDLTFLPDPLPGRSPIHIEAESLPGVL